MVSLPQHLRFDNGIRGTAGEGAFGARQLGQDGKTLDYTAKNGMLAIEMLGGAKGQKKL